MIVWRMRNMKKPDNNAKTRIDTPKNAIRPVKALTEAVDFVKTDLMPDFDFDAFNHDQIAEEGGSEQDTEEALPEVAIAVGTGSIPVIPATPSINNSEEVDKW